MRLLQPCVLASGHAVVRIGPDLVEVRHALRPNLTCRFDPAEWRSWPQTERRSRLAEFFTWAFLRGFGLDLPTEVEIRRTLGAL
jgi:hypothetical protein